MVPAVDVHDGLFPERLEELEGHEPARRLVGALQAVPEQRVVERDGHRAREDTQRGQAVLRERARDQRVLQVDDRAQHASVEQRHGEQRPHPGLAHVRIVGELPDRGGVVLDHRRQRARGVEHGGAGDGRRLGERHALDAHGITEVGLGLHDELTLLGQHQRAPLCPRVLHDELQQALQKGGQLDLGGHGLGGFDHRVEIERVGLLADIRIDVAALLRGADARAHHAEVRGQLGPAPAQLPRQGDRAPALQRVDGLANGIARQAPAPGGQVQIRRPLLREGLDVVDAVVRRANGRALVGERGVPHPAAPAQDLRRKQERLGPEVDRVLSGQRGEAPLRRDQALGHAEHGGG